MSKQLPIRRQQFETAAFLAFLAKSGCEVGKPTNRYEVVRYRAYASGGNRPVTHIVYAKDNGLLTWTGATQAHYRCFIEGAPLTGNLPPFRSELDKPAPRQAEAGPSKGEIRRAQLIERDGPDCWFCGVVMGDDCTIEHLVPKSKGGRNTLANYALAHARCNAKAADLPLVEKIALRDRLRRGVEA